MTIIVHYFHRQQAGSATNGNGLMCGTVTGLMAICINVLAAAGFAGSEVMTCGIYLYPGICQAALRNEIRLCQNAFYTM